MPSPPCPPPSPAGQGGGRAARPNPYCRNCCSPPTVKNWCRATRTSRGSGTAITRRSCTGGWARGPASTAPCPLILSRCRSLSRSWCVESAAYHADGRGADAGNSPRSRRAAGGVSIRNLAAIWRTLYSAEERRPGQVVVWGGGGGGGGGGGIDGRFAAGPDGGGIAGTGSGGNVKNKPKIEATGRAVKRERRDGDEIRLTTFIPIKIRKRGGRIVVVRRAAAEVKSNPQPALAGGAVAGVLLAAVAGRRHGRQRQRNRPTGRAAPVHGQ